MINTPLLVEIILVLAFLAVACWPSGHKVNGKSSSGRAKR